MNSPFFKFPVVPNLVYACSPFAPYASKWTSRLLNEVYSGNYDNTQLYVIDGFLLSPNIESKSVITIENGFSYSDHHPVKIRIELKK